MKIISWNMGGRKYRRVYEHAWRYLVDELRPDIAFIQEASLILPDWLRDKGQVLHRAAYKEQDWGSGLFVRDRTASEINIPTTGSYVVAADIISGPATFVAASIHVCPDSKQQSYLRELIAVIGPALQNRNFVIGGDLNAARLYDQMHKRNAYQWFFDELAAAGLHDCHWGVHRREVQSYWGRAGVGYQNDHLFVDSSWAARVLSCDVIDNADVRSMSDHGPLCLVLEAADAG